ncbi:MAG: protein kinase [Terriglobia bacterium]|jgi:serine/threonine protein kinase
MKICPKCRSTYRDEYSICPHDGARLATQFTGAEAQLAAQLAGRFRMLHRLGKGAFGTVFLAEQIAVGNRLVALKVLSGQPLDDPQYLKRFQDEAASAGRIHHPNIVTIYDYGQADDGTPYIAMEFLQGESLRDSLSRRVRLPVADVTEILQQAARGLTAAHRLGIIHRDLKPDNIFLAQDDENKLIVKIVDFGIVKLLESADHHNLSTGFLGTPRYMSFEQASGVRSDNLDARSDVYSLGVVVYEMLTGCAPFYADSPIGYFDKHRTEGPPRFRAVAPALSVPPMVEEAVMKALVKDRNQRYASALEFARDFASAAAVPTQEKTTLPLEPTLIGSELATGFKAPMIDTVEVSLLKRAKSEESFPRSSSGPTSTDLTVKTPLSSSVGTTKVPTAQPQTSRLGIAPGRQGAVAKSPIISTISEPSGTMKFVPIGVVALILIAAGVLYVSRSGKPVLPSPDPTPPVVAQPDVKRAVSHPTTPLYRDTHDRIPTQQPTPETGRLRISCDRPCRLTLDGSLQGEIESGRSTDLAVLNGKHVVEASVTDESGIAPQQRQVVVFSAATQVVGFSFSSDPAARRQQIAEGLQRAKVEEQNLDIRKALEECNRLEKLDKDNQDVKNLRQELLNLCSDHPDLDCPK